MKTKILFLFLLISLDFFAQEHFLGINTSRRVGLLNTQENPAELTNLTHKFDVNLFNISIQAANNKFSFKDLINDDKTFDDYKNDLYTSNTPFSTNIDTKVNLLGLAFKYKDWGFSISNNVYGKFTMTDVNPKLIEVIESDFEQAAYIESKDNQRINTIVYSEIALAAAKNIYKTEKHTLNVGASLKLLSPEAYSNLGVKNLKGTFSNQLNKDAFMQGATAEIDVSYAGPLTDDFENDSYSLFSLGIKGIAADLGINYQLKNEDLNYVYKLNAGISIQNIGSMTFKNNAQHYTYQLAIPENASFDISKFEDVTSAEEFNKILEESGYYTTTSSSDNIKVNLPTTISLYADYQVYNNWFATVYTKQKLSKNNKNRNFPTFNTFSIIPRYSSNFFEAYTPLSFNEVSKFTAGLGIRLGGFYIGSSSVFTALGSKAKHFDVHIGARFGLVK